MATQLTTTRPTIDTQLELILAGFANQSLAERIRRARAVFVAHQAQKAVTVETQPKAA